MSAVPVIVQPFQDPSADAGSSTLGFIVEPLIVISLLAGGVWFNRRPHEQGLPPLLSPGGVQPPRSSSRDGGRGPALPRDTSRFANNWISRTLYRYPFLLEVLYWALTYWIYQIARAISAVLFIDEGTVDTARKHGLQVLEAEKFLGIQLENRVQEWVMKHEWAMNSLNRIYSFIHIPATIAFLAFFYNSQRFSSYAPVRRTMALANLLAFVVFTLWPCMPPRMLPKWYGFVDTVHQGSMGSVWTTNRFCNQYAAMPSLHFGYSLIVGWSLFAHAPAGPKSTLRRYGLHVLFLLYPAMILLAIVSTANHYLLDAAAGFVVAVIALHTNSVLLHLLVVENYIFYALHIHKPPPSGRAEARAKDMVDDDLPRFAYDRLDDDSINGREGKKARTCSIVFGS